MRALVVVAILVCLAACGSGPGGPVEPTPPSAAPAATPTPGPLSGRWVGLTSEGQGLITTDRTGDDYCINRYDWAGTLSHQGTTASGTMTIAFVGADCRSGRRNYHISPADVGDTGPAPTTLTLSVNPSGGVSITWDEWVRTVGGVAGFLNADLAGTYTADTISLRGDRADRRSSWSVTFGLQRQ